MESEQDWEYQHTENYIEEKEQQEHAWNRKNKEQQKRYLEYIDEKIAEGTEKARKELLELFHNADFIETYKSKTQMAYRIAMMQIYEREIGAEEKITILDIGNSAEEIIEKMIGLKFLLWRIEFAGDKQAKEAVVQFVHFNSITPDMLQYMIQTATADKAGMLLELADIFIEKGMLRYAFRMLEYLDELSPGNETVLCLLADLCGKAGNQERVGEYLERIENPGRLAEGIRKKYGC